MAGMDGIVDALEAQQAELSGLVAGLDDAGWGAPTPCEGWDVADVVLHLVQTNRMAVGSLDGRLQGVMDELLAGAPPSGAATIDDGAAAMVDLHRGEPGDRVGAAWVAEAAGLVARFRAADPSARVTWVAGTLAVRTLATTRLAETWIHSGDVAAALGVHLDPTARLEPIARLAWRTLPYAFARAGRPAPGPVAFHLVGPGGEGWSFEPDEPAATTVAGPAADLCAVAARRLDPADAALSADGPDAAAVLELVRTYA